MVSIPTILFRKRHTVFAFVVLLSLCRCYKVEGQSNANADTAVIADTITYEAHIEQNPYKATAYLQRMLYKSERINFVDGINTSLMALAHLHSVTGDDEPYLTIMQQAAIVCNQSQRFKSALPTIYNAIGIIYKDKGDFELASDYYYKAVNTGESLPICKLLPAIYNNLGSLFISIQEERKVDMSEKALYYLDKGEKAAILYKAEHLQANILINMGNIYSLRGDYNKSTAYYVKALKITQDNKLYSIEHILLNNMAELKIKQNEPQKALFYLLESNKIKEGYTPIIHDAESSSFGEAYYHLHKYKLAEHYFLLTLKNARQVNFNEGVENAYDFLAKVYNQTRQYRNALVYTQLLMALKDSMASQNSTQNINQLELKYRTAEKDKQIVENKLKISQNELLISQQENNLKRKNQWLWGTSAGVIALVALLIGLYRYNRHNQKMQSKQIQILQQEQEIDKQEKEIGKLNALREGEERERGRIAQELHDGIMVQLTAAKMNFQSLINNQKDLAGKDDFQDVLKQLDNATKELRMTAHNLLPDVLLEEGLADAIFYFCKNLQQSTGLSINFQTYGQLPHLAADFELSVYRIVQELFHNIVKHARATDTLI
ncbi:MAG TPA: histidine kinase, partial [Candidatus Babeliaceae bacterium]|nr:histidine kinase [Candidatus Babeliaceae bacterium]